ncbi:MAG: hypothetical protein HY791_40435 [Deltaproteobacteria bacterium]|nr:hypothetical protein [Deltaproteobacteria bacterium]
MSVIVAHVKDGRVVEARAGEASRFELEVARDDLAGSRLEVLAYELPLSAIAFEPGVLAPRASIDGGLPPRAPDLSFAMEPIVDGARFVAVSPGSTALSRFGHARPAEVDPCVSPQATPISTPYLAERPVLVKLDESRVLLLAREDVALYERNVGLSEVSVVPSECLGSGFLAADGGLFLATCTGGIVKGVFSGSSLRIEPLPEQPELVGHEIAWMDGGRGPRGDELVGVTPTGKVATFDGIRWRSHEGLPARDPELTWLGGALWLGPGEALVGVVSEARPMWIRDGTVELVETQSTTGVSSMISSPTLGVIVGDSEASFWVMEAGRMRTLGHQGFGSWTTSMASFGDGFVFGTPFGAIGRYSAAKGMCPLSDLVVAFEPNGMVVFEDGTLLVSGSPTTNDLVWLAEMRYPGAR